MKKYDIQVTVEVLANDEKEAEEKTMLFLKTSSVVVNNPDIIDWELTEFIPSDLSKSCCC